jgi:UPF0271 protein
LLFLCCKLAPLIIFDLNCDTGEGIGNDALLMPFIQSANIACGFHAGDEGTMRATIELALRHGVQVGAHPSFLDRENFGRTEMELQKDALHALVLEQLVAIDTVAKTCGARLHHVKPHGALYNMAARDPRMARTIAGAVKEYDPTLVLYGLSCSHLISEAEALGLRTASEVFADRSYEKDGSLTPRTHPGALLPSVAASLAQVRQLVSSGTVTTRTGEVISLRAETVCIHGDGPHAVELARALASLQQEEA